MQNVRELFTVYRRNIAVAVMLHVFQQLTGCNTINYYGPQILRDAGFSGDKPQDVLYSMMFLGVLKIVGNFICVILSNKFGRKQLMLFVLPFIVASMFALSVSMYIHYALDMVVCKFWLRSYPCNSGAMD